jgi:cytidine deaminase
MNSEDELLIKAAQSVLGRLQLRDDYTAGDVAAAIRTAAGNIYTGICIDLTCGLGFCAEVAAVAEMLKHRETQIVSVVALDRHGTILAPCGRCRETLVQVDRRNRECRVLLHHGRAARLEDLLPEHWLEDPPGA